jgi:peroxiredoxin
VFGKMRLGLATTETFYTGGSLMKGSLDRCLRFAVLQLAAIGALAHAGIASAANQPPAVGDIASDFSLEAVDGEKTSLSPLLKKGPVVLIVLRGFPGYQCPVCNAQVGQFLASAKKLQARDANVILVYPGPAPGLKQHAQEFIRGKTLPENFYILLDPDFELTNAYHLRWEAKNETAYPSTFVINADGRIQFAKVSMTHGNRASVDEVLKVIPAK